MTTSKSIEDANLSLSNIPNDKYRKFFAKFIEIETLPVAEWKVVHILGFFAKKYKEAYGMEYGWKFNTPSPSKCFEVWQINSLAGKLSSNPEILKEYIEWAFQTVVPKAKRRLTSISFMTKDEVVNPYKMDLLSGKKSNNANKIIDRCVELEDKYLRIIQMHNFNCRTYGDLAFLAAADMYGFDICLNALEAAGLDPTIFERIV